MLECRSIVKTFPGVVALDEVSFQLHPGEIQALIGENGAGKSTLINIIVGVYNADRGTVLLDGDEVNFSSPRDAQHAGISVVHQERNLVPAFSVAENLFLEHPPSRWGFVDYGRMYEQALTWLEVVGLDVPPSRPVADMSPAQMQLVEIAKALSLEARFLVLDEPTSTLTPHEVQSLFQILHGLRDKGVGILFVSHKLEELFKVCERVTVLRDGRNVCQRRNLRELTSDELVTLMVGREQVVTELTPKAVDRVEPLLEVRNLATASGAADISFKLYSKEVLGLYGLVGAGRSELARALVGDDRVVKGEVLVNGESVRIRDVRDALETHGIGYVPEDRKSEGLFLIHSVTTNVAITIWHRLAKAFGWIRGFAEVTAAKEYVEKLDVKTPSMRQIVQNLSGGNQQKVSMAKWLAADAKILIVDEPTVGIDVRTKHALQDLIWDLAGKGKAIILISSDMPEMVRLADRILVMKDNRIVGELMNSRDYPKVSEAIMNLIQAVGKPNQASALEETAGS